MSQTQIILIVAALVVIAFFFWRSMREERRMRASRKARLQAGGDVRKDVLAEETVSYTHLDVYKRQVQGGLQPFEFNVHVVLFFLFNMRPHGRTHQREL